jgi:hypothetical protein
MRYIQLLISVLLMTSVAVHAEESTLKEGAKQVGKTTGEMVHKAGEVGKEVGKKVAETAKEVGHATRDGAKEFAKAVKDGDGRSKSSADSSQHSK